MISVEIVYVVAMEMDLRLPDAQSLKDKRQVVSSLLDVSRRRFGVSAAEVASQDRWQRAQLGFAVVTSSVRLAEELLDAVEELCWNHPAVEVLRAERIWLEPE